VHPLRRRTSDLTPPHSILANKLHETVHFRSLAWLFQLVKELGFADGLAKTFWMDNAPAAAAIRNCGYRGRTKRLGNKMCGAYNHAVDHDFEFDQVDGKTNPADVLTEPRCGARAPLPMLRKRRFSVVMCITLNS